MKFWITLLLPLFIVFLNGCSSEKKKSESNQTSVSSSSTGEISTPSNEKEKEVRLGEKTVLQDVNGKEYSITTTEKGLVVAGYENKVVMINFFTTWCPPCKAEIPHLNNLQEKHKENFVIISVLLEENKSNDEIKNFIKYNAINYIITNSPENYKLAQKVGSVKSIPLMFLYDKNGNYFTHYVGAVPEEMIETDIKKVL